MIKSIFLFFTFFMTVSADVTVLNNDNFDNHIKSNEYVLVKFYAPWCGHCKKLAPHYERLSTEGVKEVSIAKVDATVETALAQKHGIKGYPTLKWYVNGTEFDFKGGREFESMNAFLKKETGEWATFITETKELNDFINSLEEEDALVVSNYAPEVLRPLASKLGQLNFAHVTGSNLIPDETLRVYTKFNGEVDFHVHEDEDVLEFIRKKSIPLVNKLDSKSIKRGFDYSRKHVIVFTTPETYGEVEKQMTPVADKYSPTYIFVTVKHTNKQVVDMFGVKKFPAAFLVNLAPKLVKYPMEGDVNSKALEEHIEAFENGELVASLKSAEEPEQQEKGKPYVLVGKTFDKFVKENNNVFVKFYAPWCGHCKKLAPTWDELAEKLVDEDVVVAKYDATANENEGVDIKGFPTLIYYKNGNPIDYSGGRDVDSLQKFIAEQTTLSNSHKEL